MRNVLLRRSNIGKLENVRKAQRDGQSPTSKPERIASDGLKDFYSTLSLPEDDRYAIPAKKFIGPMQRTL